MNFLALLLASPLGNEELVIEAGTRLWNFSKGIRCCVVQADDIRAVSNEGSSGPIDCIDNILTHVRISEVQEPEFDVSPEWI